MKTFEIGNGYEADCTVGDSFCTGEIYHVVRNSEGGATLTPITRYFCWRPKYIEGFNEHWSVDCFVREHDLSPDPEWTGKSLVTALLKEEICSKPIWVSWYQSSELGGEAYGEVFEND